MRTVRAHSGSADGTRLPVSELEVMRFCYVPAGQPGDLLGLSLHVPGALESRARPTLLLVREEVELLYVPRVSSSSPRAHEDGGGWLWRGIFAVPRDLSGDPASCFSLRLYGDMRIELPAPALGPPLQASRPGPTRRWPYAVRRGALLFIVSCQLCVLPGLTSPGALADVSPSSTVGSEAPAPEAAPEPPTPTPAEKPTGEASEAVKEEPSPAPAPEATEKPSRSPVERPPEHPPAPVNAPGAPPPPAAGAAGAPAPATAQPSSSASSAGEPVTMTVSRDRHPARDGSPGGRARHEGSVPRALGQNGSAKHDSHGAHHPKRGSRSRRGHPGAAGLAAGAVAAGSVVAASEAPPMILRLPPGLETLGEDQPPSYLVPFYVAAGRSYGIPWQILAAINQVETDYGRNLSVSSAGAEGWMQFMPATWSAWGVDADHDGVANPYSPLDAIFTAARYLQANGAASDLPGAILAYNHAEWYVSEVLLRARMLEGSLTATGSERGYALPLDEQYMQPLGRTDDGVDIETAPDGALVYSITPGVVSAVASNPGGFGPNYPVVEATGGSLAGQYLYYGHVAQALVRPGERVKAGQPIAVMGHTGDAAPLAHGHIEIGLSDAGGDPLSHHGAEAWTPAGAVMRSFLVTLTSRFRAHEAKAHARALAARVARANAGRRAREEARRKRGGSPAPALPAVERRV